MKTRIIILSFFLTIGIFGCGKEADTPKGENVLVGNWIDTETAQPNGSYVNELRFNNDLTFSSKSSNYGIYGGQNPNDLSGWFEFTGNYSINSDKIGFISHKVVSYDSFYGGSPETKVQDQILFENCTFNIKDEILEINYITYPADGAENTKREFIRVK